MLLEGIRLCLVPSIERLALVKLVTWLLPSIPYGRKEWYMDSYSLHALTSWAMDNRIPEYEFNYVLNKYEENPELLQQALNILRRPG